MGCDIHVYLMNKQEDGTYKELALYTKNEAGDFHKAYIGENRNYTLFSKLAGVRGCEDEMSCGNYGIFPDAPESVKNEYDDYSYHSPRWFSWDVIKYAAKVEGMTQYEDVGENWNVVQDWLDELWVILDAYWIFDKSNVVIQIWFDS